MARFRDFQRLSKVNNTTLIGASGEMSDYQYIQQLLEHWVIEERCLDDGHSIWPPNVFEYLSTVMYNRRNKFNPLWNSIVVGGLDASGQTCVVLPPDAAKLVKRLLCSRGLQVSARLDFLVS